MFFDHVHLLSPHLRFIIHDLLTISSEKNIIIIFSCSNDIEKGFKEQYIEKIPIKLELPPLQHRSKKECFDFIKLLFQNEAIHMKRYIITEAEILKSLLLYPCEGNLKQLENDIKAGCARAFVREVNNSTGYMKLHLEDFPSCVQKGLIFYKEYIDELDKIILNDYIYTFTYKSMEKIKNNTLHDIKKTLYEVVEDKTIKLKQKGISQQISNLIIRSDFSSDLEKYTENLGNKILDKNSLSKIVDPRIISLTESFLEESSLKLNRIFSLSTFYGICLHISAAIEKPNLRTFVNKQLEEEAKKHQQEYILSIHFIDKIQNEMKIQLSVDEANFITMFISEKEVTKHPVFLIIMHGETTASSVAEVVRTLTKTDHTYAYDLSLKKEISMVYQELKTLIKQIDKGQGILVMYDMGSIRTIGENIAKDTKINISFIEMPITLIALDCARKVSTMSSLQEVYQSVSNSYERYFPYIVETYKRISKDNVIITLCMSGVGGALQIKKYLEKNLIFENLEIIALSMANRNELLYHINHIKKEHNILYTIGTDDPKLYGIPFISVSEIFSIPSEKLQMYFSINGIKVIPKAEMNYQLLFQNISEDLPHISIAGLSETFPQFIEKIDSKYHLNKNQKIGIIMHLSASIERLIVHEKIDSIKDFQKIIIKNKKLYNDVSNGIIPIENYFQIKYPDTEIACLIKIIKKI